MGGVANSGDQSTVTVERHGYVATIEFERPPMNFLDVVIITQIADAMDELAAEGDCRAIVLQSPGRHFCPGANLQQRGIRSGGPHVFDAAVRMFEQPLPVVATIQGAAIGGGLGLALSADFRFASPAARFAATFAQLGVHHGFGLSVTLPLVIGHQATLDLLYTGRRIDGDEAQRMGLVDRLVPAVELRSAAITFAESIASSAPLAVRSIRQTLRGDLPMLLREALVRERAEQAILSQTADHEEGILASIERRTPLFLGR